MKFIATAVTEDERRLVETFEDKSSAILWCESWFEDGEDESVMAAAVVDAETCEVVYVETEGFAKFPTDEAA